MLEEIKNFLFSNWQLSIAIIFFIVAVVLLCFYLINNKQLSFSRSLLLFAIFLFASIFMSTFVFPSIADAIGSLATVTAASLAIVTIKANRDLRKQDSKEKKLKEIIDWAIDIANGKYDLEFSRLQQLRENARQEWVQGGMSIPYMEIETEDLGRNRYFVKLAHSIDSELGNTTEKLNTMLLALSNDLQRPRDTSQPTSTLFPADRLAIIKDANDVIDKAIKLL